MPITLKSLRQIVFTNKLAIGYRKVNLLLVGWKHDDDNINKTKAKNHNKKKKGRAALLAATTTAPSHALLSKITPHSFSSHAP
jgi:hypothetical protein